MGKRKTKVYDLDEWNATMTKKRKPKKKKSRRQKKIKVKILSEAKKPKRQLPVSPSFKLPDHIIGRVEKPQKKQPFTSKSTQDYYNNLIRNVLGGMGGTGTRSVLKPPMKTIQMDKLPKCDICKHNTAVYDTKTRFGAHAYLCRPCYLKHGVQPSTRLEKRVKVAAKKTTKIPSVSVPLSMDSVVTVRCPHCREGRSVEPDANYTVTCENCGNKYRVVSMI